MKKFIVEANIRGFMFDPKYFSSRNAAIRFARAQWEWHGGDFYINGRLKKGWYGSPVLRPVVKIRNTNRRAKREALPRGTMFA